MRLHSRSVRLPFLMFLAVIVAAFTVGFASAAMADLHLPSSPIGAPPSVVSQRVVATPVPPPTPRPVVSHTPRARPASVAVPASDDAFWDALQRCETPNGDTHPLYQGPYQFHPDTAARAGGTDRAAAKRWAARLAAEGTSPGSRAGWPVCWWRAKAAVGYAPH